MEFLYFLLIGAIAGWTAGQIMKGRGFGTIGNIVVGIIGAYVGGFMLGNLGLNIGDSELFNSLVTAVVGAIVFLFVLGLIRKGK